MDMNYKLLNISAVAFIPEQECVKELVSEVSNYSDKSSQIFSSAKKYIEGVRNSSKLGTIEAFISEYGLSNDEGVAIMCLAEALLRIPDSKTACELIADKFVNADWSKHIGKSDSFLVNAASLGLLLTGKIIGASEKNIITKLIKRIGEPAVKVILQKAIFIMGKTFVMGETIEKALDNSKAYPKYFFSYDILGEGARSKKQAENYIKGYMHAIKTIAATIDSTTPQNKRTSISVKLSALHPRYELLKKDRVLNELVPTILKIVVSAKEHGINVTIDAEEASRLDISLMVINELFANPLLENYNGLGLAVQAYQKRALKVIDLLDEMAHQYNKIIPIRLVKGAYWDGEIKKAQMLGIEGFPVFTRKYHTDVSYLACANKLLNGSRFYPQFATHNALTIASITNIAQGKEFELQRLYGMGEQLHNFVMDHEKVNCRIYAPVGAYEDLLCYLIRRLIENGASTSFVHLFADRTTPVEELIKDPIKTTIDSGFKSMENIMEPLNLYKGKRSNSKGIDLGNMQQIEKMQHQLAAFADKKWSANPMIAGKEIAGGEQFKRMQPANLNKEIGQVTYATAEHCQQALASAVAAFPGWNETSVEKRADILNNIADLMEKHQIELMSLCIREAGKAFSDSIAEVREAVDFCRFYAYEAKKIYNFENSLDGPTGENNRLSLHGRGAFVCISPWNFPLAIFTGQVVAALVTGNTVIAKPADQTPLIAYYTVKLMHEAGVPKDVLTFLPAKGKVIGESLLTQNKVAGVVFTGSTATARTINRTLAEREADIVPLIAETGGQNCMIVDSSALLEQAIDDVVLSAFGSAGQRCSALRVLYVQDDIADKFIELLNGAMDELGVGETSDLSVDVGPVIDQAARNTLNEHITKMKQQAKLINHVAVPDKLEGYYVSPYAFEIKSINELTQEMFGPVLHVIRFKANEIDQVIEDINSTGYGLTFGIHSRINDRINHLKSRIKAGNIYVNRSMTGAVVGVQPFGGEGLSGTGPKAGGPHYLLRFCTERCVSVNTAAVGGNLELFAA